MKNQIRFEDCVGKTIESVYCAGYAASAYILFTDGTFAALSASSGYDGDVSIEPVDLSDDLSPYDLMQAGVITKAEYDEVQAANERQRKETQEHRERWEFERLKAKFGQ